MHAVLQDGCNGYLNFQQGHIGFQSGEKEGLAIRSEDNARKKCFECLSVLDFGFFIDDAARRQSALLSPINFDGDR